MKRKIFIFVIIVLLATFLRLWKLGVVPPSPNWDEVALGYNAYSLMLTGKDEYGTAFPFVLRSYDDYKPALYTYLVIPAVSIFGLDVFAVRLPSVLLGLLTVIATYFLAKQLFKNDWISLLTSFLLAISPWHIQFSRIAFESNAGLALNVLGTLFFLKGLKTRIFLLLSSVIFGLNLYMYQSSKVFTPLLVFALVILYRRNLLAVHRKFLISTIILGVIILLPMGYYIVTSKEALARAQGVSIFSDTTTFLAENAIRLDADKQRKDLLGVVLDNRRILYIKEVIAGYIVHFDLNWLFIKGDIARHHAPNMGLLYLWELPFLLIGIYTIVFNSQKEGIDKKTKALLFSWFLLAPIPASITSGVPHAVRTINFLPTFQIFIAIGLLTTVAAISNIKYQIAKIQVKYLIFTLYFLFIILNFSYYINQYFVQLNYFTSADWQYGYKEAITQVKNIENKYDKIIVSNKPHLDQSYMFFLFYLKYPPSLYQKEAQGVSGGFRENHAFGKFEFRPIQWEVEEKNPKILFVGRPEDFTNATKILKVIHFLDGKPAINIVEG